MAKTKKTAAKKVSKKATVKAPKAAAGKLARAPKKTAAK